MKIYRNNVGIEMTLEEFINLIEDEDRIYDVTELIATLEEDEMLREDEARLALEEEEGLEDLNPFDATGNVALLERPPAINQYFIQMPPQAALTDTDYLDELTKLESDELVKIRRIIERFGSLLD